jgi:hypothetical protein
VFAKKDGASFAIALDGDEGKEEVDNGFHRGGSCAVYRFW